MVSDEPSSVSAPSFAGIYNFDRGDHADVKAAAFAVDLISKGATFVAIHGKGILQTIPEIQDYFSAHETDPWICRVLIPPQVLVSILNEYLSGSMADASWASQLGAWMKVLEGYSNLWVAIDFPGQLENAATVISYWVDTPSFVDGHPASSPAGGYSATEVARVLVDDVYVAIDNLFSAFVFDRGDFSYPNAELRKLGFVYGCRVNDPMEMVGQNYARFKPLFSKTLLVSVRESLAAMRLGDRQALIYSSGFVGMTGQPEMGKSPDLYVLVGDANAPRDDAMTLDTLHSLSRLLKAASILTTISENYLPAVSRMTDQLALLVSQVSGKGQQLLIDTSLANTAEQLTTLADREKLVAGELLAAYTRLGELRAYLSDFFRSALVVRQEVRSTEEEWEMSLLLGDHSITRDRLAQSEFVASALVSAESALAAIADDLQNSHVAATGTRLSLRNRFSQIVQQSVGDSPELVETCFVLMAFKPDLDEIYQEIVLPIFGESSLGLRCYRADEIYGTSEIVQDIWKAIRRARVVIAELTGRNPNVLYELGLTHVLRKPAILLTQSMEDVPFDLRHLRCIVYSLGPAGLRKLRADLEATLKQTLASRSREVVLFE